MIRARSHVALLLAAVLLLGLAFAPRAAGSTNEGLLDANCPGPPDSFVDPEPDERDVQTFTAQRTGSLVRGEIGISKAGGAADWVMQIVTTDGSGAPTNNVLASTTIANASVPDGESMIVGLFATPASVVAGQQFGLLIARPGESSTLRDRFGAPCQGQEFFSIADGPFTAEPNFDFVFAVFVEPSNAFVKPSNAFALGAIARNKNKGTATLSVNVPNPGELALSGNGVSAAKAIRVNAVRAQTTVRLVIRARGPKLRKLVRTGRVAVRPRISYTPDGGDRGTRSTRITLIRR